MKMKRLYMAAVAALVAGLFAGATVGPASAASGLLTVDRHHLNCGTVTVGTGGITCGTVTVTNTSDVSVTVSVGFAAGSSDLFGLANNTCFVGGTNATLAPGDSCSFDVTFGSPVETGHFSAQVVVTGFAAAGSSSTKVGVGGRATP